MEKKINNWNEFLSSENETLNEGFFSKKPKMIDKYEEKFKTLENNLTSCENIEQAESIYKQAIDLQTEFVNEPNSIFNFMDRTIDSLMFSEFVQHFISLYVDILEKLKHKKQFAQDQKREQTFEKKNKY